MESSLIHSRSVIKLRYAPDGQPERTTTVLMGHAHDLPLGLEAQLVGHRAGDRFEVSLEGPAFDPALVQVVPRAAFDRLPEAGTLLYTQDEQGRPLAVRVLGVLEAGVEVDANPENAGTRQRVRVEIVSVRDAQPDELEHGHVHGEGGVHH
ncbi:FKBP-type peptidyl-prolyl cis-trans isomerase SlyD [Deinobacterium chartae]|uniref:peptidylprolyl isomerase n=1 Tax=Deinobacterium chartae TaxID=521158 RepID=A0A841HYX7_9DEIO|nr:peptidylprolyl isomerase [Deinobacterium chartae]MBB6097874.1 FKBP-type peptidyl-prolyl cis-trans isomerase SlyD [Deinobacterium chartae]